MNPWLALLIAALLGGNTYFVKRLIDEQDALKQLVYSVRQEVAVMHAMMDVTQAQRRK